MKKNMGAIDSVVRITIAVIIAILYFVDILTGTLGAILIILAAIFTITSFIGKCPLYLIFGINTCTKKKGKE